MHVRIVIKIFFLMRFPIVVRSFHKRLPWQYSGKGRDAVLVRNLRHVTTELLWQIFMLFFGFF